MNPIGIQKSNNISLPCHSTKQRFTTKELNLPIAKINPFPFHMTHDSMRNVLNKRALSKKRILNFVNLRTHVHNFIDINFLTKRIYFRYF